MDLNDLLLIAVVALLCGTVAQLTSGYFRGGWIVHIGLAFIGASAGVAFSRSFNVIEIYNFKLGTTNFPLVWSLIGSVLVVAVIGFAVKPSRR